MRKAPRDLIVRLLPLGTRPWDGSEDANVDFAAYLASGRMVDFTAITPQNILRLWQTSLPDAKSMVSPGQLVVRRIDEECLWDAVEKWLELEERVADHQRQAGQEDEGDVADDIDRAADKQDP